MRKEIRLAWGIFFIFGLTAWAQDEEAEKLAEKDLKKSTNLTWEANKELTANDFTGAETDYRRAISKSKKNAVAPYN